MTLTWGVAAGVDQSRWTVMLVVTSGIGVTSASRRCSAPWRIAFWAVCKSVWPCQCPVPELFVDERRGRGVGPAGQFGRRHLRSAQARRQLPPRRGVAVPGA